jgi:UDP-glucose 4-epimerase
MKKKILITGASGYLATPLAFHFQNKVPSKVDIVLASRQTEKLSGFIELEKFPKRTFDILDNSSFNKALEGIDIVIHLAAMGARASEMDPQKAHIINIKQVEELLECAIKMGVSEFLYFSTVHVYGSPLKGELKETTIPQPVSVYAKTHFEAEKIILKSIQQKQIDGAILRLSNVIGAPFLLNEEIESLIAMYACKTAIFEKSINLSSSGQALRDFVSIQTVGDFLINWIFERSENRQGDIYNIGSGNTQRIVDLVDVIRERCHLNYGHYPNLTTKVSLPNEEPYFHLDISSAQRVVQNQPASIIEAIDSMLDFFSRMKRGIQ